VQVVDFGGGARLLLLQDLSDLWRDGGAHWAVGNIAKRILRIVV
jgi:hypothetical protein